MNNGGGRGERRDRPGGGGNRGGGGGQRGGFGGPARPFTPSGATRSWTRRDDADGPPAPPPPPRPDLGGAPAYDDE